MDIRRTAPAGMRIPVPIYRDRPASPRETSRSNSQTSQESSRPRLGMGIPGTRIDDVPPPLPPPRYNDDLAHGVDLAWNWANTDPFDHRRQLAPIKPGSSLHGSFLESRGNFTHNRDEDDDDDEEMMDIDDDEYARRSSNVSTVRSPSDAQIRFGGAVPALVRKPPSPSIANPR